MVSKPVSEDTDLDARARYAILKKLDTTMPPAVRPRAEVVDVVDMVDHTFKAEETNTGHRGPRRVGEQAQTSDSCVGGRIASA